MKTKSSHSKTVPSTPYHFKTEYQRGVERFNKEVEDNTRKIEWADRKTNIDKDHSGSLPKVTPPYSSKMVYHSS